VLCSRGGGAGAQVTLSACPEADFEPIDIRHAELSHACASAPPPGPLLLIPPSPSLLLPPRAVITL
jgi:hypothetical protein